MRKNLLDAVASRAKELDRGGYVRVYRTSGKEYPDSLRALVGAILEASGVEFSTGERVLPDSKLIADFVIGNRILFLGNLPTETERRKLLGMGLKPVVISRSDLRSDIFDEGVRVSGDLKGNGRLQTIFLDDPSFNFDYAHILPKTEKCSVMHGHTSSALVELVGEPKDGMVVDFNDAKPIIRDAIAALDHKLFINEKYVVERGRSDIRLAFETIHGPFELRVPKATTVLMEGEATVENLAQELLRMVAPKMPANVTAVGVYVYEGLNKGTHLLAQVHSREAERQRRER